MRNRLQTSIEAFSVCLHKWAFIIRSKSFNCNSASFTNQVVGCGYSPQWMLHELIYLSVEVSTTLWISYLCNGNGRRQWTMRSLHEVLNTPLLRLIIWFWNLMSPVRHSFLWSFAWLFPILLNFRRLATSLSFLYLPMIHHVWWRIV